MSDAVNHPNHYGGDTPYEAIKVITAWNLGFDLGNTVKYISRAGKKGGESEVKDLKKAAWYLNHRIFQLEPPPSTPVPNPAMYQREHTYIDGCKDKCGSCSLCCLSVCNDCGLYEGALTTQCPKKSVPMETSERIYRGELNFRGGIWVAECSEHSPAFVRRQHRFCVCPLPVPKQEGGMLVCGNCNLPQITYSVTVSDKTETKA